MMKRVLTLILTVLLVAAVALPWTGPARADTVIVIVNDMPITNYDVTQRIKIESLLSGGTQELTRQQALNELVNDVLKQGDAVRKRAVPTDREIDETLRRVVASLKLDMDGFRAKLRQEGITMNAVRRKIALTLAFTRLLNAKFQIRTDVSEEDVTRQLEQFKNDPRLKARTVYKLQEIVLPVENAGAMTDQLLMARAVEAQQVMARYKGCASARKASEGIFNVQTGKTLEADPERLPPELRAALEKAGTKRLVGPIRSAAGIQLLGLCSKTQVAPEPPSREQVRSYLVNQRYASYSDRYLKDLRRTAIIDFKDKSYQPKN